MKKLFVLLMLSIAIGGCGQGRWVGGNEWRFKKREMEKRQRENGLGKENARSGFGDKAVN